MLVDLNNTCFSSNILHLRKRYHLSRRTLASLAGISLRTLCQIEQNRNPPVVDYAVASRFREIFGLPLEILFHEEKPSP